MKNTSFRSTLSPLLIITFGGMLALGVCYLLFMLINRLGQSLLFSNTSTAMPVFIIRRVIALVLLALLLVLFRTKLPDIAKATILVGPLGFLMTTAILTFYQQPVWAIVVTAVITAISAVLIYKSKKPWFYYYTLAITVLVSIALAWPRA